MNGLGIEPRRGCRDRALLLLMHRVESVLLKAGHSATLVLALCASCVAPALAQDDPIGRVAQALRNTHANIATQAQADAALEAVRETRARVDWMNYDREVECASKFFASSCSADARREHRAALKRIREVEIDAERTLRKLRDEARETRRAEAQREAEAEERALVGQRERDRAAFEKRVADADRRQREAERRAAQRAREADEERARRVARAAELAEREREAAQRESQAGSSVAEYERKQREARERQAEVERRRKEREARESAPPPPR